MLGNPGQAYMYTRRKIQIQDASQLAVVRVFVMTNSTWVGISTYTIQPVVRRRVELEKVHTLSRRCARYDGSADRHIEEFA